MKVFVLAADLGAKRRHNASYDATLALASRHRVYLKVFFPLQPCSGAKGHTHLIIVERKIRAIHHALDAINPIGHLIDLPLFTVHLDHSFVRISSVTILGPMHPLLLLLLSRFLELFHFSERYLVLGPEFSHLYLYLFTILQVFGFMLLHSAALLFIVLNTL